MYRILQTFMDGRTRYVEGELRHFDEVPTEFAKAGWVYIEGVTPDEKVPTEFKLDIQNSVIGLVDNSAEVSNG